MRAESFFYHFAMPTTAIYDRGRGDVAYGVGDLHSTFHDGANGDGDDLEAGFEYGYAHFMELACARLTHAAE